MKKATPYVVFSLVIALMLSVIITISQGTKERVMDLNNSGIWVTNDARGLFGRANRSAGALDAALTDPNQTGDLANLNLDVFQDQEAVLAWNKSQSRLFAVDTRAALAIAETVVPVGPLGAVAMGGSVIAAIFDQGQINTTAYQPSGVTDLNQLASQDGLAKLDVLLGADAGVDIAVDAQGLVFAASTSGQTALIDRSGKVRYGTVGQQLTSVKVSLVGGVGVVADPATGDVFLTNGIHRQFGPDSMVVPQQPGDAQQVVVATTSGLSAIPLTNREPTTLYTHAEIGSSRPAQPVVIGSVVYGAWSGTPGRVVRINSGAIQPSIFPVDGSLLAAPVFRVNRGMVVLNDMATGQVFDIEETVSVDNWDDVAPRAQENLGEEQANSNSGPQAQPDHLWVRPGRTSLLHVLDNDSDPGAGIVVITEVSGVDADQVAISPDGQTLVVTPAASQASDLTVTYTITNGSAGADQSSSAPVTISMRPGRENTSPNSYGALGQDPANPDFTVVSGGSLSIAPGWAWRDADCDPVFVVQASVAGRVLPVSGQGLVQYAAPVTAGQIIETVEYTVSDGLGAPVNGTFFVQVQAVDALVGAAPVAMSDAVRGVVGRPVVFYPLDNDIPGADPLNRQAELALAAPIVGRVGMAVTTDLTMGAVSVLADQAGIYFLDYVISYGTSFAYGQIRVDIAADDALIAMPDQAVARGTVPVTVDVVANDHDGSGSVLTVVSVAPEDPDRVRVTVVQGRWLRVEMLSAVVWPSPARIAYQVVNSSGEQATGWVEVTQEPVVVVDHVSVVDDHVIVRVGDVTAIPVLANDSSQSGQPLVLNSNVPGLPAGQVKVEDPSAPIGQAFDNVGSAFVSGNQIRYQAPTTGDQVRRLRIEYQAEVALGSPVTGYVWVDVVPEPVTDPADPRVGTGNRAPLPTTVEVRVMAGDTIDIPINVYGQDPDGDSVTVTGLSTPPQYGRVTQVGANSLTYEAYPTTQGSGMDVLQFYVQDRYGAVGIASVRIGIAPLGNPVAPVAVDDVVTAQPGVGVTVYPLANDLIGLGSEQLSVVLDANPVGVELDPNLQVVHTVAPKLDDPAVAVTYHDLANWVPGPSAQITVRSQPGYLNPPIIYDHLATQTAAGVATVDVLDNAWDVDGAVEMIHVLAVGAPASFEGGRVSVPLTDRGQIVPFIVEDGDGAQAMAVVFVPSLTAARPVLSSAGMISMAMNSSKTVDLNDYITSPRQQPVYLTMAAHAWTSPGAYLQLTVDSARRVSLTSFGDYVGPAALTVEVRDALGADDPQALTGVVTIPVQIGPATPVLWCPGTFQEVVQGGQPLTLDIASLCHAWMPSSAGVDSLQFTGSWDAGGDGLVVTGVGGKLPAHQLVIRAEASARPGSEAILVVGVAGHPSVQARIQVRVIGAAKPQVAVLSLTDVRQGTTVAAPVTVTSPMLDATQNVINVTQVSGPTSTVSFDDQSIRVTADGVGVAAFTVLASDIADDSRTDRQVTGSFTVTVYGVPDPPSPPQPGLQLRSRAAVVSFTPGAENGSPITGYELSWDGGSQSCGLNTTCEVTGLTNGVAYSFQVRAINKAGPSPWSAFGPPVTPNAIPGAVTGFAVGQPGCGTVVLTWTGATGEGTAPTSYHVSRGGQAEPITVAGDQRSLVLTDLDNNTVYTITILAQNEAGLSMAPVSLPGQSSCQPLWSGDAVLTVAAQDLGDTAQVRVSWPPADPQGPGPVTYLVTRNGPDGLKTFAPTTQTSLGDTDRISYQGQMYTYSVTAVNATGGADHTSTPLSQQWSAVGVPASWSTVGGAAAVAVEATGVDQQVRVTVNRFPDLRDSQGQVVVRNGTTEIARLTAAQPSAVVGGFANGQDLTLGFTACNSGGSCNSAQAATLPSGPFGPLAVPEIGAEQGTGRTVCFTATGNGNGRQATLVVTGDNGLGEVFRTDGAGALTSGQRCVDAKAWDTVVNFTAVLQTATTEPPRTDPASASDSTRSAISVPDDWAPGQVSATVTGQSGAVELNVARFPVSNGGSLVVYYSVNDGPPVRIANPGLLTINNLPNGQEAVIRVWADNGSKQNTAQVFPLTPYGPLDPPTLTARAGAGTQICLQADTPSSGTNGRPANLVVMQGGNLVWESGLRNGVINSGPDHCVDAGDYGKQMDFTAQLITQTGLNRTDSAATAATGTSAIGTPGALNPTWVSGVPTGVSGQATVSVGQWPAHNGGAADHIRVQVSGLPGGTITLTEAAPSSIQNGFTNGTATTVTFTPCNALNCNPAGAVTVTITTTAPPPPTTQPPPTKPPTQPPTQPPATQPPTQPPKTTAPPAKPSVTIKAGSSAVSCVNNTKTCYNIIFTLSNFNGKVTCSAHLVGGVAILGFSTTGKTFDSRNADQKAGDGRHFAKGNKFEVKCSDPNGGSFDKTLNFN